MRQLALVTLLLTILSTSAYSSQDSIGPNGINSSGLALDGDGVGIGQVENARPGSQIFDTAIGAETLYNTAVTPTDVFFRHTDNVTFTATPNAGGEVGLHAIEMASVMISTDATTKGVSPGADLYSAGINATGPMAEDVYAQTAITANYLATLSTQEIWAINMSLAVSADGQDADGTSTLTSYIDWSARVHDVLYVIAGYEQLPTPGGPMPASGPLPSDNFNGITVGFSKKNGAKYRQVDGDNLFNADNFSERTFVDILAPGRDLQFASANDVTTTVPDPVRNGTSPATAHVTGTAALLQQYAALQIQNVGGPRWNTNNNARRHEVMKAVIMNSADKIEEGSITSYNGVDIPTGGLLGMERTVLDSNGDDWFASEANDDTTDFEVFPNSGFVPLDDEMGVGHLNANRAFSQFIFGEFDESNTVDVPVIGWDYGTTTGEDDINRYRFDEPLKGGSFISITLAWDRMVTFASGGGDGQYDVGDTFVDYKDTDGVGEPPADSVINDLDLFFLPRGSANEFAALAQSIAIEGSVEHIFFQVPEDGQYEFWVMQHDQETVTGANQNYGVAWWALGSSLVSQGDFDGSGTVDGADLAQWQGDFGLNGDSDANNDGVSDGADFLIWQRNFGLSAANPNATAVPEPATCLLLLLGCVLMGECRRRW